MTGIQLELCGDSTWNWDELQNYWSSAAELINAVRTRTVLKSEFMTALVANILSDVNCSK